MNIDKTVITGALSVLLLAACAPLTPNLDSQFGDSVNTVKAMQTINPSASVNADPVSGVDGISGQSAMKSYKKSFEAPPPATVTNIINIGSGK